MTPKFLFFCLQICLIKNALSQCYGSSPAVIAESLGLIGAASAGPAGGPLLLKNFPMPALGLSIVADELVIEGLVSVNGKLPFVGTVALEGVLPTEGHGTVVYNCGNGEVGIVGEGAGAIGSGPTFSGPGPITGSSSLVPSESAAKTSLGIGAAVNAAGLNAMTGL